MTYLFPIEPLKHTVFEHPESLQFFREQGVVLTDDPYRADVFVMRHYNPLLGFRPGRTVKKRLREGVPLLLWTHEPRFCYTDKDIMFLKGTVIQVMNMYTRNVLFSNFTFYGKFADGILAPATNISFSPQSVVGLATHVDPDKQPFIMGGVDIDLTVKRQKLLYDGFRLGMADIYGVGWPSAMKIKASRGKGWHKGKIGILSNYQFNICLENTAFEYYCTEKIWDSIKGYCLPVYSSFNNRIYDTFPKNSFIDFDDFANNDELLQFIRNISPQEYLTRLNLCIETFNHVHATTDFRMERQRALMAVVDKLKTLYRVTAG